VVRIKTLVVRVVSAAGISLDFQRVEDGHSDVHEDDVRVMSRDEGADLFRVGCFAHDSHVEDRGNEVAKGRHGRGLDRRR
jgi:hypothetical protein